MKLGMINNALEQTDFDRVKGFGLEFVEFCVNVDSHEMYTKLVNETEEIKNRLKTVGLLAGSIGRWGVDQINKDGSISKEEMAKNKALIEVAQRLDCPVFVCGCNYLEEYSLYENCTFAIELFKELIAFGKEHGVKIATYNCRWNNFVHSDPTWSIIHGYLKELCIKFDPSHSIYAQGENYLSEMEKWADRFAHIHIKGSLMINGKHIDDPPAGLDITDWNAFMGILYAKGYEGGLSIEPHSAIWKDDLGERGIRQTVNMMKRHIV